jgi:hypothetical protein
VVFPFYRMKLDENLASVHAYLCADGYVIKNPKTQKQKYYMLGFRNTNLVLLKDFQKKFYKVFRVKPYLIPKQRCRIGSRWIYEKLTTDFGSFYSYEWKAPKMNKELSKIWLRSFFDCESWVFCKTHQNRHIGIDSVNEKGIDTIVEMLENLKIKTIKKINNKRKIYRIFIYGKENLKKFQEEIGFLHPEKSKKLEEALRDYIKYTWIFPEEERKLKRFILKIMLEKCRINQKKYIRIFSKEGINLSNLKKGLKKYFYINSLLSKKINGISTPYYELSINKKEEVQKLIDLKVTPNLFK